MTSFFAEPSEHYRFSVYPHARGIAGRDAYLSVGRIKDRPRRQPVPIAGYRGAIRV